MNRTVTGILVFPDVEVLDFCGPFEVFSVTRLDGTNRREEPSPFEVQVVAETKEPVLATGGLQCAAGPRHRELSSARPSCRSRRLGLTP